MFASHRWKKILAAFYAAFVPSFLNAMPASAAAPTPWGLGLQRPSSPIDARIDDFHNAVLWIIVLISVFVLALLLYVMARYKKSANPNPARFTHNVKLEIVWTLVPCLILIGIAAISFPLLYYMDRLPAKADVTLKVTGHQWYWSYEYPDNGGIAFDSHALWDTPSTTDEQAKQLAKESAANWLIKNEPLRMLEVDNRVVLPVGQVVRVQVTGGDVEHSWFVPSAGVNRMAVPGKLSELWLKLDREGVVYGQCSMICGTNHGYMPIVIEGVTPERFAAWVEAKKKSAGIEPAGILLFAAAPAAPVK